jgi:hypothetical protein
LALFDLEYHLLCIQDTARLAHERQPSQT